MERFDTFYYTEAFISDKRTLSLLSILSDSVYLFYLSPDYFLKPLEERWETEKEQPFFRKAPVECKLITPTYHERHIEFIKENRELVNTGVKWTPSLGQDRGYIKIGSRYPQRAWG